MDGYSYTTASETEKCQYCGKPIVYGHVEMMGCEYDAPLECPCVTEKQERERADRIRVGREAIRSELRRRAGLSKRAVQQRFRNYRADEGQKEAFQAARQFAKEYIEGKNDGTGLLLIGGVGSGKSHLAAAIINAVVDYIQIPDRSAENSSDGVCYGTPNSDAYFVGSVSLLEQLRSSYDSDGGTGQIMEQCQKAGLLVLDDVGAEKTTDWARERLFEIIDYRYNDCAPVVITTNSSIGELRQKLGDRICDRIRSMCKTYTVTSKSHRQTADNTPPVVENGEDFDDPPVIQPRETTIYDRMRE